MAPRAADAPRTRITRKRVHAADKTAKWVITIGGFTAVAAVIGIMVYLAVVALKLFAPGEADLRFAQRGFGDASPFLAVRPDEQGIALMAITEGGGLRVANLLTGEIIDERPLAAPGKRVTAFSRSVRGGDTAFGFEDGSIQIGKVRFTQSFLFDEESEQALADLQQGEARAWRGGVVERTPLGQLSRMVVEVDLPDPAPIRTGEGAVRLIDYFAGDAAEYVVALREDGTFVLNQVRKITPLGGGAPRIRLRTFELPYEAPREGAPLPEKLFVTGDGANVLALWGDGVCQRYNIQRPADAFLAETVELLDPGRTLTAAGMMIGARTLVVGDDAGNVYGCFAARNEFDLDGDGRRFVRAHVLAPQSAAITSIDVSTRDRTFVTGDASGEIVVRNMTSGAVVTRVALAGGRAVAHAVLLPRLNGVVGVGREGAYDLWSMDVAHPEASVKGVFGKVWYEGEPAPAHVYQSSSGDDAAEAKYGLTPLIHGTLKATVYTMLIAVPLGILAAIFTSEFLSPRVKNVVKPVTEMMASLPSVVLGFIAAMLLAPLVRDILPGAILAFALVPLGALLGAHLWHFAPVRVAARASRGMRFAMIAAITGVSFAAALLAGPLFEGVLFQPRDRDVLVRAGAFETIDQSEWPGWFGAGGAVTLNDTLRLQREGLYYRQGEVLRPAGDLNDPDIRAAIAADSLDEPSIRLWLDGVVGSAWPGWFVVSLPAAAIVVSLLLSRLLGPRLRDLERSASVMKQAVTELIKLAGSVAAVCFLAAVSASFLTALGFDIRTTLFGPFEQRNSFVVGLAMAIAVIPIIYTISEDALSSVPDQLRSASLGAGATQWQTATRVVLPVALGGIFSACMVGLGRAVGETMIVLMATGNTPIMSWNVFDGFRTLSANIAVELPEAPKDSTHYRVLFLCGLVLFAMTFGVNTIAEALRQRVRKRSAGL